MKRNVSKYLTAQQILSSTNSTMNIHGFSRLMVRLSNTTLSVSRRVVAGRNVYIFRDHHVLDFLKNVLDKLT